MPRACKTSIACSAFDAEAGKMRHLICIKCHFQSICGSDFAHAFSHNVRFRTSPVEPMHFPVEPMQLPVEPMHFPVEPMQIFVEAMQLYVEAMQLPMEAMQLPVEAMQLPVGTIQSKRSTFGCQFGSESPLYLS